MDWIAWRFNEIQDRNKTEWQFPLFITKHQVIKARSERQALISSIAQVNESAFFFLTQSCCFNHKTQPLIFILFWKQVGKVLQNLTKKELWKYFTGFIFGYFLLQFQ